MTEKISHKADAERLVLMNDLADLAAAQVHATLYAAEQTAALVEQARIANLIALREAREPSDDWDFNSPTPPIRSEIRKGLGL